MRKEITLVTGANSGVGLVITKYLNQKGKSVIAGVRRKETFKMFEGMDHVEPVVLDITKQSDLDSFMNFMKEKDYIVKGLVNNAGVGNYPSLLYYETVEEMKEQFDVNVFGMHAITKACMPHLIETKGRIVNLGSGIGVVTHFSGGTYSMTKHAVEAYTDALSLELKPFDIHVSIIELAQEGYNGHLGKRFWNERRLKFEKLLENDNNPYLNDIKLYLDYYNPYFEAKDEYGVENKDLPLSNDVTEATYHGLFDPKPNVRYFIGNLETRTRYFSKAFIELIQYNQNKLAYSFEELTDFMKKIYESDILEEHYSFLPDRYKNK